MMKRLTTIVLVLMCCLFSGAQPLVRPIPPRNVHHTHRLPGVNERRLARLEKMRNANIARRHRVGPWRAKTQPETQRGLVLLVQFTDVKMQTGAATQWNNRFNQQGYSQYGHVGSVRDYFMEQSYGLLTIDFDVVGPLTLSKNHDYYGTSPNSDLDDRAAEMVIEAMKLADSQVNYADYDWNGDGEVEQVYVIFAGQTEWDTQGYIWPHEWNLDDANFYGNGSGIQTLDGVYIDTYAVSNELADANTLEGIGTACHEFSHCLGYPDFYDTEYSGGTAGQYWDVLDAGSYNGPSGLGEVPSPYTAYERWTAGWIDLIPLTEPVKITDMPAINEEGVAYVINNTGNANEYYILENRQQVTFGTGNGGHGLMVWHIDYSASAWAANSVNTDKNHQRMTFLPADGKVGDLKNTGDDTYQYQITPTDEAGDPYPGTKNVNSVQQLTWFTAERNGSKRHANLIHDISETNDGKISFTYGDYIALPMPQIAYPTDVSPDSFTANWEPVDGATSYNLEVEAMTGEEGPATILEEDFAKFSSVNDNAQIIDFDLYTNTEGWDGDVVYGTKSAAIRISSSKKAGYVTTPVLANAEGVLQVDFDAAFYNVDGSSVLVTVLCDEQTVATEIVRLTADRASYSLTFEDVPSGCQVEFASTAKAKRFYLYNVNIMDMSGTGGTVTKYSGLTSTSYTVQPLVAEQYYYRVQAVCDEGTSEWSEWVDVDIASGIDAKPMGKKQDDIMYDLSGRRLMSTPQRGFYISNGKTFFVR